MRVTDQFVLNHIHQDNFNDYEHLMRSLNKLEDYPDGRTLKIRLKHLLTNILNNMKPHYGPREH